ETGLPIVDDEDDSSEQVSSEQESEQEAISLLGDTEEEAQMLSDALDDAFARLTGDKLDDDQEVSEELGLDQKRIDQEEQDLDNLTGKIVEGAKDLDLDLGFLQSEDENQENNSNSES
ncbi:hypothetical protein OAT67_09695, partial [Bacteriovoracaceae bacterium]|nr:hypothetical protein [Bacteriovoracaceae bacterium]